MKTYRLILLAIAFLAIAITPVHYAASQEDITIQNINFGELLMGNEIFKEDLQDCVVGVEFDGMTCQTCPCGGAINTFLEWHQKYNSQGFTLLSFYVKDDAKEKFAAFCKSRKVPFSVYYEGRISGVEITDLPAFVLFDQTGQMIYNGHPKDAGTKIAEAMKAAPDYLTGAGPYKKLKMLADKAKERKDLGKILKTIKEKYLKSENADEAAEAEKLVARLTRYGNKLLRKAGSKKDKEPLVCLNLYQQAAAVFKDDEIGDNADKTIKELKEDKTFQNNLKADKELVGMMPDIEKLKASTKCVTFDKECNACKKKNPSLQILIPKARNIIKNYPDSPAAAKVKELLPIE